VSFARAADGARIRFETVGAGPPLVLLAGQANSARWWDPIRVDFAAGHRTVAIDTLGTGGSDAPPGAEYSTRRFAGDVVAVLDELGIERAHVYGTSMGGKVAQWLAVDHPDRVGAVVLGCTTAGGVHGMVADPAVLRPLAGPAPAADAALAALMFSREWRRDHPGPYAVLGDPAMTSQARRGHRRASAAHDAWDVVPGVRAPTLVVHGSADEFCPPANAGLLAGRIPGSELLVLDGARHAYFEEFRAVASPAVIAFLDRHPLPAEP
jgi:pimeloyl-ACP methyl ester carboxylesterase